MAAPEATLADKLSVTDTTTIGELFYGLYPLVDEAIRVIPGDNPCLRRVSGKDYAHGAKSTGTAHDLTIGVTNPYRSRIPDNNFLGILSRRYWTAKGPMRFPARVSTIGARFQKGDATDPWDGTLTSDIWAAVADKDRPEPDQWDYTSRLERGHHDPTYLQADQRLSALGVHRKAIILTAAQRIIDGIEALDQIVQGEEPLVALAGLRAQFPKFDRQGLPFPIEGA